MTFSDGLALIIFSAVAASNTILPTPAPGPAGRPFVRGSAFFSAATSKIGNSSCSRSDPDSVASASSGFRIFFWALPVKKSLPVAISTAQRTPARPVRLALRVCSIHSVPCSTVNSTSCGYL